MTDMHTKKLFDFTGRDVELRMGLDSDSLGTEQGDVAAPLFIELQDDDQPNREGLPTVVRIRLNDWRLDDAILQLQQLRDQLDRARRPWCDDCADVASTDCKTSELVTAEEIMDEHPWLRTF